MARTAWLVDGCTTANKAPNVVLGNGFSIAFNASTFAYGALRAKAEEDGLLTPVIRRFFDDLGTLGFEVVIKSLLDAARALRNMREDRCGCLDDEARALAGLHPDRPHNISNDAYERVYRFLVRFQQIYTLNYDLLTYSAVMHGRETVFDLSFRADDGFRESTPMSRSLSGTACTHIRDKTSFTVTERSAFTEPTASYGSSPIPEPIRRCWIKSVPSWMKGGSAVRGRRNVDRQDLTNWDEPLPRVRASSLAACSQGVLAYGSPPARTTNT